MDNNERGIAVRRASPPIITIKPRMLPTAVHVGLCADATGSSLYYSKGIVLTMQFMLAAMSAVIARVLCSLQIHRDSDYGEEPILLTSNSSIDETLKELKGVKLEGGGDEKETHAAAVVQALDTMPWIAHRTSGRDVMILTTSSETKPVPGLSFEDIGHRIRSQNILFYHVGEQSLGLKTICDTAGGYFLPLSNTPDEAECRRAAAACVSSITASIASGATEPIRPQRL